MSKGWIGVDLDGTLAVYEDWKGPEDIGAPVQPMVDRVKVWLAEGREVKIFTARVDTGGRDRPDYVRLVTRAIERWCLRHLGEVLPITNVKDFNMIELWDDRAVQVEKNTGKPVGFSTRGL